MLVLSRPGDEGGVRCDSAATTRFLKWEHFEVCATPAANPARPAVHGPRRFRCGDKLTSPPTRASNRHHTSTLPLPLVQGSNSYHHISLRLIPLHPASSQSCPGTRPTQHGFGSEAGQDGKLPPSRKESSVDRDSPLITGVARFREYYHTLRPSSLLLTCRQLNYRMRATMTDGRQLVGQMLAFDKVRSPGVPPWSSELTISQHMNVVLADCEEFRKVKRKTKQGGAPGAQSGGQVVETEEKRSLGLAIVRGATIVSCAVDGPPPADPSARLGQSAASAPVQSGPGIAKPAAGRGAGIGLQGPAMGVGGPGFPGFQAPPGFGGRGGFPPPGFPAAGGPPAGFPPPGFQGGRGFPGR